MRRFLRPGPTAAALALFSLAACSTAPELAPLSGTTGATGSQAAGTGSSDTAQGLAVADQAFLAQAAYGGLAEVALGELAQEQASSSDVRDFAGRMVAEHGRANSELVSVARSKGMTPPTAPDEGRQAVATALSSLEGVEFDRQYMQQQYAEHQVAVALYEAQANAGSDPDVRAFAAKWLPALRGHAEDIRMMMRQAVSMTR